MRKIDTLIAAAARGLARLAADERGATAIEYALIASGVGAAIAATVYALGTPVKDLYTKVSDTM